MHKLIKAIKSLLFYCYAKLRFGKKCKVHAVNSLEGKFKIDIKQKSSIKIGHFLMSKGPLYLTSINGANLKIGDNVFFNHNCSITAMDNIIIGNHAMFGNNVVLVDHNHINTATSSNDFSHATIEIGDHVWIGANCVILPGVHIGNGAVIAANSVVNKNVAKNELWGGVPAKKIKDIKLAKDAKEEYNKIKHTYDIL